MTTSNKMLPRGLAAALALLLGPSVVQAKEVWLEARPFTPASGVLAGVPMWGYKDCGTSFAGCAAASATSPGPVISVPAGEGLTVRLRNSLPEPTSVHLVGRRSGSPLPVNADALRVDGRLQAFTAEIAPGATGTYIWSAGDLGTGGGTFLYQSGSHVQLQVQMGLYGAVEHNALNSSCAMPPCAYPSVPYSSSKTLVFSEVDPALHSPPTAVNASATGYRPRYFLINGAPFSGAGAPAVTATAGTRVLLRLVNAGLESHAPQLLGGYFDVVAEDGYPASVTRRQTAALLPAAKTLDVVFTPAASGTYTLFDRRLRLVNDDDTGGGMMARIVISGGGGGGQAPTAVSDVFFFTANNFSVPSNPAAYSVTFPSPGVLGNDTDPQNDALRVKPGSVTALQGAAGGKADVDTTTGVKKGRARFRAPVAKWVGDAYLTYIASEAATAAHLDSAPATAHVVHDQHLTRTRFQNPSGTANDRWDLIGEVRGLPAATSVKVSFVKNTGNNNCTRVGQVIATIPIAASATPTTWTYNGKMPNPSGCDRIRFEIAIPAANGVPAHTATYNTNFQRV